MTKCEYCKEKSIDIVIELRNYQEILLHNTCISCGNTWEERFLKQCEVSK
jgi:hypothetical protein